MIRRHLTQRLLAALGDRPAVLITGVRQCGKTTLVRNLAQHGHKADYVTLDDATTLAAARADPAGFLSGFAGNVILDEVQHAPGLFPAIKMEVDRDRRPGRFLLTGSANVLVLPRISESLAGRMAVLTLWPLSASEIAATAPFLCDRLFDESGLQSLDGDPVDRAAVIRAVAAGGFPEPVGWYPESRREWFESYVTTMLRRELHDLADVDVLVAMPRLLRSLAGRVSGLLNLADVGRMVEMPYTSLRRYVAILEAAYLVCPVPAWSANLGLRSIKSPKVHLADTGLAAHLLDLGPEALMGGSPSLGPLVESFVATEMRKHAGAGEVRPTVYHWRSHAGAEVDIVLEDRRGRLVAIEVKSSATVRSEDVRNLRAFAEAVGDRFVRGVAAYLGPTIVPFARNIHAVPIGLLLGMRAVQLARPGDKPE